jgi:flavin-dependent dehydrogenase
MHDVIVVGGSVAGAATAIHLAEAGRDVLLLERASFPRRKPCGEGLFPAGVAELRRLGVLDELAHATSELRSIRFHAGDYTAEARFGHSQETALGVQRVFLDHALLKRAEWAGVTVRTSILVQALNVAGGKVAGVRTSAGSFEGRAVVAADGLHSRLRRQARLSTGRRGDRYGITAHLECRAQPGSAVDVYFEGGYELYLTPVGRERLNVALLARRAFMRRFAGNLRGAFESIVVDHPALRDFGGLSDAPMAAGPFPARCTRTWRANFVLVGDAAGFYDGITGEGMSIALVSARACAEAVDAYLRAGSYDSFRDYDAARRSLARNSDLLGRLSLALGRHPALASFAVRNLGRRPESFERLVAVNTGELPLRALSPRELWALATGL